jgi:hypothetical protein
MADDLLELARLALTATLSDDLAPQAAFLRSVARRVATDPQFTGSFPVDVVRGSLQILSDGSLKEGPAQTLSELLGAVGLVTLAAKIEGSGPSIPEVRESVELVTERRTFVP